MSIQGAGRQWAEAWEQQRKADVDPVRNLMIQHIHYTYR